MGLLIGRTISVIRGFSFWGILFLLMLVLGFNVPINSIVQEALSGEPYINYYCRYFLLSIPVFLVLVLINKISFKLVSFYDLALIDLRAFPTYPSAYLEMKPLFHERRTETQKQIFRYDLFSCISCLCVTILWWIVFLCGVYYIIITDNFIKAAILSYTVKQIIIRISILVWSAFLLYILAESLNALAIKKRRQKEYEERKTRRERKKIFRSYSEKYPERLPSGCSACGGPYPLCKDGCPLFDDD